MEVAAMLHDNESLETLSMYSPNARFGDYLVFVAAIQPNTTLRKFWVHCVAVIVDDDEKKDVVSVLKKNYGLEEFPTLGRGAGDANSILQLNRAGRRYLVQDGSSISKGVAVLSRVSSDTNSVFLHLLENPRLRDRSAVEITSSIDTIIDNTRSRGPGNRHSGSKREQQAPSQTGKEPRRRLE